jgi:hypothetical protein
MLPPLLLTGLLTGVSGHPHLRTLAALLALDAALGLALGGSGSLLGLLGLLHLLSLGLLGLDVRQVGGALGSTGLRAHGPALLDHIERGTDDGTLRLDCPARALLGNLL